MKKDSLLKISAVSFSLACLWFFHMFRELLFPREFRYFNYSPPIIPRYSAILLSVGLLALLFALLIGISLWAKNRGVQTAANLAFLLLGVCSFSSVGFEIRTWIDPDAETLLRGPLPLMVLATCVGLSVRRKFSFRETARYLQSIALILLPFGVILCLETSMVWFRGGEKSLGPSQIEKVSDRHDTAENRKRLVWIIFDELDYATMLNRPPGVDMPGFDQLISESFVAQNAYSPDMYTRDSIPSLLIGKPIDRAAPVSSSDLKLLYADGSPPTLLSATENVITDTDRTGGTVGISGWWHPYPRLFADSIEMGYWRAGYFRSCEDAGPCTFDTLLRSLENIPFIYKIFPGLVVERFYKKMGIDAHNERREFLREKAIQLVSSSGPDLVFLHLPAPHEPTDIGFEPGRDYYDSLRYVDETLRMVRAKIEESGDWDRTTLIVTSDHWLRWSKTEDMYTHLDDAKRQSVMNDIRIPYIVKLAGSSSAVSYKSPFNSVITRLLIQAIRQGNIKTNEDVASFLDRLATERPDLMSYRPRRTGN